MEREELGALVDRIKVPGWKFTWDRDYIHIEIEGGVVNTYKPEQTDRHFGDTIEIFPEETEADVFQKLFTHIQFLNDHELREQFEVDGVKVFDPHATDPKTGEQLANFHKFWYVNKASAFSIPLEGTA